MDDYLRSIALLFVLLNPFLLSVYLGGLIHDQSSALVFRILLRAAVISGTVFVVVALTGDAIFTHIAQVHFASFQIFGGITFLIIGLRLILLGVEGLENIRGRARLLAGAVAMPFMIGPGTISASIFAGRRLAPLAAIGAIAIAMTIVVVSVILYKIAHDYVRSRNETLVQRYVEIAGRVTALFTGSFAVEMIVRGVETWLRDLGILT